MDILCIHCYTGCYSITPCLFSYLFWFVMHGRYAWCFVMTRIELHQVLSIPEWLLNSYHFVYIQWRISPMLVFSKKNRSRVSSHHFVYGLKPSVWGRVVQTHGQSSRSTSLCVASPEQANSHSSDASYHGKQGYNHIQWSMSPIYCIIETHREKHGMMG